MLFSLFNVVSWMGFFRLTFFYNKSQNSEISNLMLNKEENYSQDQFHIFVCQVCGTIHVAWFNYK